MSDLEAVIPCPEHGELERHPGTWVEHFTWEKPCPGGRRVRLVEVQSDRDVVDPFVAEALYDEHIAWNMHVRGELNTESDWPTWPELSELALEHWHGMAVAARLSLIAAVDGPYYRLENIE